MKKAVKKYLLQFKPSIDFQTGDTIIRKETKTGIKVVHLSDILLNGGYRNEGIGDVEGIPYGEVKVPPITLCNLKRFLKYI